MLFHPFSTSTGNLHSLLLTAIFHCYYLLLSKTKFHHFIILMFFSISKKLNRWFLIFNTFSIYFRRRKYSALIHKTIVNILLKICVCLKNTVVGTFENIYKVHMHTEEKANQSQPLRGWRSCFSQTPWRPLVHSNSSFTYFHVSSTIYLILKVYSI